ncbi:MAG: response regulator [Chloroflexaceae bacterium]|nr:response regulator [Chloroflexaceae bacterium]
MLSEPAELTPQADETPTSKGTILIVDDNGYNRELLSRLLIREGYTVLQAPDGGQALEFLRAYHADLVLLDIMMPQMDGYDVLAQLKADPSLRYIPVVVISALNDYSSIVRCVELGADDYLYKPFNLTLLKARVYTCLEKKYLRDQEQHYMQQLEAERQKTEWLLLNIFPRPVAERLKNGADTIADSFADATVMFADLVGFTELATNTSAVELVRMLNDIFLYFDQLSIDHGLEKIKTIGDAYMVVGGLPVAHAYHAEQVADMALAMQATIARFNQQRDLKLALRIGISTGPVVAGVIGSKRFSYDLWGDTVNIASRMESHGIPGSIQVSGSTYERLRQRYLFTERGVQHIKGKGDMPTYLLVGKKT